MLKCNKCEANLCRTPWDVASFSTLFLGNGALLVSGTTDTDFVAIIPSGVDNRAIHYVGEMEKTEVVSMMETDLGALLKTLQKFDSTCFDKIIAACGNIPRELTMFSENIEQIAKRSYSRR